MGSHRIIKPEERTYPCTFSRQQGATVSKGAELSFISFILLDQKTSSSSRSLGKGRTVKEEEESRGM